MLHTGKSRFARVSRRLSRAFARRVGRRRHRALSRTVRRRGRRPGDASGLSFAKVRRALGPPSTVYAARCSVRDDLAALIIEPIQGRGGVHRSAARLSASAARPMRRARHRHDRRRDIHWIRANRSVVRGRPRERRSRYPLHRQSDGLRIADQRRGRPRRRSWTRGRHRAARRCTRRRISAIRSVRRGARDDRRAGTSRPSGEGETLGMQCSRPTPAALRSHSSRRPTFADAACFRASRCATPRCAAARRQAFACRNGRDLLAVRTWPATS